MQIERAQDSKTKERPLRQSPSRQPMTDADFFKHAGDCRPLVPHLGCAGQCSLSHYLAEDEGKGSVPGSGTGTSGNTLTSAQASSCWAGRGQLALGRGGLAILGVAVGLRTIAGKGQVSVEIPSPATP